MVFENRTAAGKKPHKRSRSGKSKSGKTSHNQAPIAGPSTAVASVGASGQMDVDWLSHF